MNVQKNFESLSIDFNNNIGDIRYNLSQNLENIYLKNFNITQLSKINTHKIDYDNPFSDLPLISMPIIIINGL